MIVPRRSDRIAAVLRNEDGEIIYDGNGDDRKPIETPDVNVGRLWLNVLERRAKLYGLDLERSAAFGAPITRELLAEVVGWSPQHDVIDVEGEEESDEQRALDHGSQTDAIRLSIRVHRHAEASVIAEPPTTSGTELEAAGRRICGITCAGLPAPTPGAEDARR